MQPVAAEDVAAALAAVAVEQPLNRTIELAGPKAIRMDDLVRQFLTAQGDERQVITDPHARYYGLEVDDRSLTPGLQPRLGPTCFENWLSSQSIGVAR